MSAKTDTLRKEIANIQKRIIKARNEEVSKTSELMKIENSCTHDWSDPELEKGSKSTFFKRCNFCGKIMRSANISVKF